MARITILTRDGRSHNLDESDGITVMEAARNVGIDEMLALCGGSCSCATCHIYVEGLEPEQLPAMSDDEDELLSSSSFRMDQSRLACQLILSEAMNGMIATIAPED